MNEITEKVEKAKMKKLSEILELAMPSYIKIINERERAVGEGKARGSMCFRLAAIVPRVISHEEFMQAQRAIYDKIGDFAFLGEYLESKGLKTTALAQIRFYRQWIKELKAEGK